MNRWMAVVCVVLGSWSTAFGQVPLPQPPSVQLQPVLAPQPPHPVVRPGQQVPPVQPGQQVVVQIQMIEVSRARLLARGVATTSDLFRHRPEMETDTYGVFDGAHCREVLDSLRKDGMVKVLSEPTIVTSAGNRASFHVGGKARVAVRGRDGEMAVEARPFGTEVDVLPVFTAEGKLRLDFRVEVSELDQVHAVVVRGEKVPGRSARACATRVDMKPGQTFVVGGMVSTRRETEMGGVPYLSEIPYLGAPFRRVRQSTAEVELVMLVTADLANRKE